MPAKKVTRKPVTRKPAKKVIKKPIKKVARKPAPKTVRKPAARKPVKKVITRKPAAPKTSRKPAARKPIKKIARKPASPKQVARRLPQPRKDFSLRQFGYHLHDNEDTRRRALATATRSLVYFKRMTPHDADVLIKRRLNLIRNLTAVPKNKAILTYDIDHIMSGGGIKGAIGKSMLTKKDKETLKLAKAAQLMGAKYTLGKHKKRSSPKSRRSPKSRKSPKSRRSPSYSSRSRRSPRSPMYSQHHYYGGGLRGLIGKSMLSKKDKETLKMAKAAQVLGAEYTFGKHSVPTKPDVHTGGSCNPGYMMGGRHRVLHFATY